MTSDSLLTKVKRWVVRDPATADAAAGGASTEGTHAESLEILRHRAASAVVDLDDAVRSSGAELALAVQQEGRGACTRFVTALESARDLSGQAFARHQRAAEIARAEPHDARAERFELSHVMDLARRAHVVLDAETEAFAALRDLRSRLPEMLDDLAAEADAVESAVPEAAADLSLLREEHDEAALASVLDNPERATTLVVAARRLVEDGRHHLDADDRATGVAAARGAESALQRARAEIDGVAAARSALTTAHEDLRAALNSIHEDLRDVQRLQATDERTTAAVARAEPVIEDATTTLRCGGDLLTALAALTRAEEDIDAALVEYREARETERRAATRLERRVRNSRVFVAGVGRRAEYLPGGADADTRSLLAAATALVDEADSLASRDPAAAAARLDDAMARAKEVQDGIDRVVVAGALADHESDQRSRYRHHSQGGGLGELVFDGIFDLVSGWGGSGGFGGGGRF